MSQRRHHKRRYELDPILLNNGSNIRIIVMEEATAAAGRVRSEQADDEFYLSDVGGGMTTSLESFLTSADRAIAVEYSPQTGSPSRTTEFTDDNNNNNNNNGLTAHDEERVQLESSEGFNEDHVDDQECTELEDTAIARDEAIGQNALDSAHNNAIQTRDSGNQNLPVEFPETEQKFDALKNVRAFRAKENLSKLPEPLPMPPPPPPPPPVTNAREPPLNTNSTANLLQRRITKDNLHRYANRVQSLLQKLTSAEESAHNSSTAQTKIIHKKDWLRERSDPFQARQALAEQSKKSAEKEISRSAESDAARREFNRTGNAKGSVQNLVSKFENINVILKKKSAAQDYSIRNPINNKHSRQRPSSMDSTRAMVNDFNQLFTKSSSSITDNNSANVERDNKSQKQDVSHTQNTAGDTAKLANSTNSIVKRVKSDLIAENRLSANNEIAKSHNYRALTGTAEQPDVIDMEMQQKISRFILLEKLLGQKQLDRFVFLICKSLPEFDIFLQRELDQNINSKSRLTLTKSDGKHDDDDNAQNPDSSNIGEVIEAFIKNLTDMRVIGENNNQKNFSSVPNNWVDLARRRKQTRQLTELLTSRANRIKSNSDTESNKVFNSDNWTDHLQELLAAELNNTLDSILQSDMSVDSSVYASYLQNARHNLRRTTNKRASMATNTAGVGGTAAGGAKRKLLIKKHYGARRAQSSYQRSVRSTVSGATATAKPNTQTTKSNIQTQDKMFQSHMALLKYMQLKRFIENQKNLCK